MPFWGKTLKAVSTVPAAWIGVGKGIYDAASGKGSFEDGANKTFEKIVDSAEKFGEENGKSITNAAIGLAATVAGTEYKKHRS
jgi:hypothetical protein